MPLDLLPKDIRDLYECHEWKHACAILATDFPDEFADIIAALRAFRLRKSMILEAGKNISPISKAFNREFFQRGWVEKGFHTKIVVDKAEMESPTHDVDCFKNRIVRQEVLR